MIQRCENSNLRCYPRYGGRGITVCERWHTFENFYADMGPRPSKRHTLERRDNAVGYSPDNCYWATYSEQANNTRKNQVIEHNGIRRTVAQWADALGFNRHILYSRLKLHWTADEILNTRPGAIRHVYPRNKPGSGSATKNVN